MTRREIDTLWQQALHQSVEEGEQFTRYRFAELVAAKGREAADKRIAELEAREKILVSANSLANIERNEAERKLAVAREALNNLASWGEGECVTGSFDEPVAAAVSRQALAQIGEK